MSNCRKCSVELNNENCSASYLKNNNHICNNCAAITQAKEYDKNRKNIIEKLGNQCQCCKIDDYQMLLIASKEKTKNNGKHINKLCNIELSDLTSQFKCLCYNCSTNINAYGKCSHKFENQQVPDNILPVSDRNIINNNLSTEDKKKRSAILRSIQTLKVKLETIQAYGNQCNSCQENNLLFLTLDHINNNSLCETLKNIDFFNYLKSLGYPGKNTELQILCFNCKNKKDCNTKIHSNIPSNYIKQEYNLSKQDNDKLLQQARQFYYQINKETL